MYLGKKWAEFFQRYAACAEGEPGKDGIQSQTISNDVYELNRKCLNQIFELKNEKSFICVQYLKTLKDLRSKTLGASNSLPGKAHPKVAVIEIHRLLNEIQPKFEGTVNVCSYSELFFFIDKPKTIYNSYLFVFSLHFYHFLVFVMRRFV